MIKILITNVFHIAIILYHGWKDVFESLMHSLWFRESIRQYQSLIKQLTYKDMDHNNQDKMISFLAQKGNIENVARSCIIV